MVLHLYHYINDAILMFVKLISAYSTEIHDIVHKHILPELNTIKKLAMFQSKLKKSNLYLESFIFYIGKYRQFILSKFNVLKFG